MSDKAFSKIVKENLEKIGAEEYQLIHIIRDLKRFETVEIKRNEHGNLEYIYTKKEKYIFLTNNAG